MTTSDIQDATQALIDFMSEMKKWEDLYCNLYKAENGGPEKNGASAKADLLIIYNKFLTEKDRKTGRLAGPHAGYPAEFDPDCEKIVASETVGAKKIVLTTKWIHPALADFTEDHRFTMIKTNNKWLLDKKESYSSYKQKWLNQVL